MKKSFFAIFIICFSATLLAGQKYNPHEQRWETVPDDWQMKYNAHEQTWSYQPPNAQVEYNAHEQKWDWNSGHNRNDRNRR